MVSIIIPVYNAENTIVRALHSCDGQAMKEIIVVDNNSTDGSMELVHQLTDRLPLVIISEDNPGASYARNAGLNRAEGNFIQFLDADDELLPSKIETQLKLFKSDNIGFVAGNYLVQKDQELVKFSIDESKSPFFNLFQGHLGITSSNLWRKSALQKVEGWSGHLKSSQEADLMFKMFKAGFTSAIDPNFLTIIHHDAQQRISTQNEAANAIRFVELRKQMIEWLKQDNEKDFLLNETSYYHSFFQALCSVHENDRKLGKKLLSSEMIVLLNKLDSFDKLKLTLKVLL